MSRLEKLRRLTPRQRRLVAETVLSLVSSVLQVRLLPFGRVASWHGWVPSDEGTDLTEAQVETALEIKRFVGAVARRTPWTSSCLMQSLSAATLLRRRGIGSVTYLGMAPKPEGYDAHSWTVAGDRCITGGPGRQRFTVVASYRAPVL
ncbi:MAG: lasso peptide biosynthesis B2 protein [Nocardioides sp.]|nr:lasso peptide biosynthesis B2 protein [Nocardioides sp.]